MYSAYKMSPVLFCSILAHCSGWFWHSQAVSCTIFLAGGMLLIGADWPWTSQPESREDAWPWRGSRPSLGLQPSAAAYLSQAWFTLLMTCHRNVNGSSTPRARDCSNLSEPGEAQTQGREAKWQVEAESKAMCKLRRFTWRMWGLFKSRGAPMAEQRASRLALGSGCKASERCWSQKQRFKQEWFLPGITRDSTEAGDPSWDLRKILPHFQSKIFIKKKEDHLPGKSK